ncbi:NERD domain-containing protein [Streptomyces sp. B1866]|uniref:NERD domain-containing protein n=1 Tax=Streptomyces sp. B1866 TaxID=3075431 RepID=UPI00288F43F1|nr:NERD domain-containing protein [Streptomyces sp. B1866]MDT3395186.1 NERD domain-containing protein [Streptomyces sp. B1866]
MPGRPRQSGGCADPARGKVGQGFPRHESTIDSRRSDGDGSRTAPGAQAHPAPPRPPKQWFQERPSPYPHEQDALDHIRRLMPPAEPYRAWATFSFTAQSGRINECDLLIAVPAGLYLVEIKGHPGRLLNTGSTWNFHGADRMRTIGNPLHLTDLKSKELKSQLQWAARKQGVNARALPRVEPAVFLSAPDLDSHLDEVQRIRVYGRDEGTSGLPRIWQDFLGLPPDRPERRITPEFSRGGPGRGRCGPSRRAG